MQLVYGACYHVLFYLGGTLINEDHVIAGKMGPRDEFDLVYVDAMQWQVRFVTKYNFNELDPRLTLIIKHGDAVIVTATNLRAIYG